MIDLKQSGPRLNSGKKNKIVNFESSQPLISEGEDKPLLASGVVDNKVYIDSSG